MSTRSKKRKVPSEAWDQHKEMITRLFGQGTLKNLIDTMKDEHGFEASISQYEAQLRQWGIRKNTKREEWEKLFDESIGLVPSSRDDVLVVTPAGRTKPRSSLKRARRWVKRNSSPRATQREEDQGTSAPGGDNRQDRDEITPGLDPQLGESEHSRPWNLELQQQNGDAPEDRNLLMTSEFEYNMAILLAGIAQERGSFPDVVASAMEVCRPDIAPHAIPSSPGLGSNNSDDTQASSGSSDRETTGDNEAENSTLVPGSLPSHPVALTQEIFSFGFPGGDILDPSEFSTDSLLSQSLVFESTWPPQLNPWLHTLPHTELENDNVRWFIEITALLKTGSASFRDTVNEFRDVGSELKILADFLPGPSAVTSSGERARIDFVRLLFVSMLNSVENFPVGEALKYFCGHPMFRASILTILMYCPRRDVSLTLADVLFRNAISTGDGYMVRQILQTGLVPVNDTVCFGGPEDGSSQTNKLRFSPIELAASKQHYGVMVELINAGADVNKSYASPRDLNDDPGRPRHESLVAAEGGALNRLVQYCNYRDVDVALDCARLLGQAGAVLGTHTFASHLHLFPRKVVEEVLSKSLRASDHSSFFRGPDCPLSRLRQDFTDQDATFLLEVMINLCSLYKDVHSDHAECLSNSEEVHLALVEGARRGHVHFVNKLLSGAPVNQQRLHEVFCAAIRSGKEDLVDLVLDHEPDLDPPAFTLGTDEHMTTPLAEGIKQDDNEFIGFLDSQGAFDHLDDRSRFEAAVLAAVSVGETSLSYLRMLFGRTWVTRQSTGYLRPPAHALEFALNCGNDEVVRILLDAGVQADDYYRVLQAALRTRNTAIVRNVLEVGFSSSKSKHSAAGGPAVLETALEMGNFDNISAIQQAFPQIPFPLAGIDALWEHHKDDAFRDSFQRLLQSRLPDPNFDAILNRSLAVAVQHDDRETSELLVGMGADPWDRSVIRAKLQYKRGTLYSVLGDEAHILAVSRCIGTRIFADWLVEWPDQSMTLDAVLASRAVDLARLEQPNQPYHQHRRLTPLGLAILGPTSETGPMPQLIRKLLVAGADPSAVAEVIDSGPGMHSTRSAFMLAIQTGKASIVKMFLQDYIPMSHRSVMLHMPALPPNRQTPLQYAVEVGSIDVVRFLLRMGADVNDPPARQGGGTALQFAAMSGNCVMAAELLAHGADLHAKPSKIDGRWPIEGAAEKGRLDMIQLLWNAKQKTGKHDGFEDRQCLRAMRFSRENGHRGCVRLISKLSGKSEGCPVDCGAPWLAY